MSAKNQPGAQRAVDNQVKAEKPQQVETAWLIAVHGPMRHLFTNELFTKDPKKVEIDGFAAVQIEAGKLERVTV